MKHRPHPSSPCASLARASFSSRALAAALLTLGATAALAHAAPLQDPPAPAQPAAAKPEEKLKEWPKLEGKAAATMRADVEKLRKPNTPAMGEAAEAALVAVGAAAAPDLLAALGKEKDLEARLRVENVLDQITGAPHTRLLAPEFANKSTSVRTWTLKRCSMFPDSELRAAAEEALAKVQAAKAKKPDLEGADDELYAAALCVTSAGGLAGLDALSSAALDQWGKRGPEIRAALNGVRSDEATDRVLPLVAESDRKKIVAGLNLLAGCGSRKAVGAVRPHLDSTDNSIRVAAINAMRGIVDGAAPIDKLSAFDAIEMAKQWKERAL
jgi:Spy/CpxP family protein refolding chaperone